MVSGMQKGVFIALVVAVISFAINTSGYFNPSKSPIVQTNNGPVQGFIAYSRDGREYASYIGIPYAQPPIQQLRFEPPVPAKEWTGVLQANSYAPDCYQFDAIVRGRFQGDEDCLYLNVFTHRPLETKASKSAVLVWIHGGGFLSGGAKQYDAKYFLDQDVVLVTINYRLGPLGFLNTGDDTITGNMGLKDQRLALQWVQNNIERFGGDPKKVTIFGESAGGASVHAHIISSSSKNLFQKGILQSGSMSAPWSLSSNPARQAKTHAKRVGCPDNDTKKMVACLKKLSPKQITQPLVEFMAKSPFTAPDDHFSPSIESPKSINPMFTENPRILLEQGKFNNVPVLMGVTSGEGGLRSARIEAINMGVETIDKKWNDYAPMLLIYDRERKEVSEKIRKHYFSDQPFNSAHDGFFKNFTIMMSDGWFFHSLHKTAIYHNHYAPMYLYFYDYDSNLPGVYSILKAVNSDDWLMADIKMGLSVISDMFKKFMGYPGPHEYGACHGDDLLQLFKLEWILEIGQRSGDYHFSKNMVKSFADFANSKEPLQFNGKEWPVIEAKMATQQQPLIFMKLDKEGGIIKEPFFERLSFWDSLNIRN